MTRANVNAVVAARARSCSPRYFPPVWQTDCAGLVPRESRSGTLCGRSRLSKLGSARVRHALYFPALTAIRHNPIIRAFSARLRTAQKPKMVVVGAAMRKLLHIVYGVLKHQRPFAPTLARA